jgi:hypothetical protein
MLVRLLNDEAGFVVSSELALIATILVIGLIVGLVAIRDAVVQELGDIAGSIGNINQTYSYTGVTGHTASTSGSLRSDTTDNCDVPADAAAGGEPACMDVVTGPAAEG